MFALTLLMVQSEAVNFFIYLWQIVQTVATNELGQLIGNLFKLDL